MEEFRFLVVRRRGAGEWLVKLPWAPWRFRAAQLERQALLSGMFTGHSVGLFLVDPDDRENLSDAVEIVERPSHESSQWLFVRGESVVRAANDLHTGNWVLFVLDDLPANPLPVPDHIDASPDSVIGMRDALGAKACVLSWADDIEWTIVEPAGDDDTPERAGGA